MMKKADRHSSLPMVLKELNTTASVKKNFKNNTDVSAHVPIVAQCIVRTVNELKHARPANKYTIWHVNESVNYVLLLPSLSLWSLKAGLFLGAPLKLRFLSGATISCRGSSSVFDFRALSVVESGDVVSSDSSSELAGKMVLKVEEDSSCGSNSTVRTAGDRLKLDVC